MTTTSFKTADLYLAAAVKLILQVEPTYENKNGRIVLFCFTASDQLYRAINSYNSGTSLNAFEYAQCIKHLRGEMHARKGTK